MKSSTNDIVKEVEIDEKKLIYFDGQIYGKLRGFDIELDKNLFKHSLFSLTHVKKTLRNMIEEKINNFLNAPLDSINFGDISKIKLNDNIIIYWGEEPIGKLSKGDKIYSPLTEVLNTEFISTENKLLISSKLQKWVDDEIKNNLKPIKEKIDNTLSSQVRAIVFNCFENLGTFEVDDFKQFIKTISIDDKQQLSKQGIRIGAKYFFMPNFMKKKSIELNALLWNNYNGYDSSDNLPLPKDGRVSFNSNTTMPTSYWKSIGYICINNFAFRVDIFEKIFFLARQKIKKGPFLESSDLMNPLGCNTNQLKDVLLFCGYSFMTMNDKKKLFFLQTKKKKINKKETTKEKKAKKYIKKKVTIKVDPNSPFAVLEKLL